MKLQLHSGAVDYSSLCYLRNLSNIIHISKNKIQSVHILAKTKKFAQINVPKIVRVLSTKYCSQKVYIPEKTKIVRI